MGITMPESGEVIVFGEPFRRAQLDRIGYLPEERGLYKKMRLIDLGEVRLSARGAHLRRYVMNLWYYLPGLIVARQIVLLAKNPGGVVFLGILDVWLT
jgi:hypothetical protein